MGKGPNEMAHGGRPRRVRCNHTIQIDSSDVPCSTVKCHLDGSDGAQRLGGCQPGGAGGWVEAGDARDRNGDRQAAP